MKNCLLFQAPSVLLNKHGFYKDYEFLSFVSKYYNDDLMFRRILHNVDQFTEKAGDDPNKLILIQPYVHCLLAYHFRTHYPVNAVCFHSAGIIPALIFSGLAEYAPVCEFFTQFNRTYYNVAWEIGEKIDLIQVRVENMEHETVSQAIREANDGKSNIYDNIFLKDIRAKDSTRVCGGRKVLRNFLRHLRQRYDGCAFNHCQRVGAHHLPFPELEACVPHFIKDIVLKPIEYVLIDNQGQAWESHIPATLYDLLCKTLFQPLNFLEMTVQMNRIAQRIATINDGIIGKMLRRTGVNQAQIIYFNQEAGRYESKNRKLSRHGTETP